jgi:hypothetical protein
MMTKPRRRPVAEIIQKKVIRWENGSWGVAFRYSDRTRVAYPVGSREDAEQELLRPRPPEPVGDDSGSLVLAD